MLISDAVELVGRLIDGYPHGRPPNQRSYIGALAAVLCQYPRMVAANVADPFKGVAREVKFLPTVADLVAWCERESAWMTNIVRGQDRERQAREQAADLKTAAAELAADRAIRPTLQQMRDKHGQDWGLGAAERENSEAAQARRAVFMEANRRALEAEYEAAGMEPKEGAPGIPVSPSLLRQLQDRPAPMREDQGERVAG